MGSRKIEREEGKTEEGRGKRLNQHKHKNIQK
jgi:hypothetical protein